MGAHYRSTQFGRWMCCLWACFAVFLASCGAPQQPPPLVLNQLPTAEQQVVAVKAEPSAGSTAITQPPITVQQSTPAPLSQKEQAATTTAIRASVSAGNEVPSSVLAQLQSRGVNSDGVVIHMGKGEPIGQWIYAVAVPFYDLFEDTTLAELQRWWSFGDGVLVVSAETAAVLTTQWGEPAATVQTLDPSDISDRLWQRDGARAIVPFEQLTPRIKPLSIAGNSPFSSNFDVSSYPLVVTIGANGDSSTVSALRDALVQPLSNRQEEKLTTVAVTGVTALVRATAFAMEQNGILWAGEEVRGVLNSADIAHISNEVAFVDSCPYPDPVGGAIFCSDPRYFELIQDLGIDVMELTGNHVNDYGAQYLTASIELYQQAGMKYFGGGRNLVDAQTPAVFEHNGNRIVFLGCNSFGPYGAWAREDYAGSRSCDSALEEQIERFSAEGAIVITTLQYNEYYEYGVPYQQQVDFRRYVDAGAAIVSGSQGHHLQAFDLYRDGFIHYGPGNLFFDQMFSFGTRQAFIDEYVVYDGNLAGVNLHTYLIEAYARPRLMTADERIQVLQTVFGFSLFE